MFVSENNGYGLSTPTNEQYRCETLQIKEKDMAWKVILLTEITFWRYIIYCQIEKFDD
jgi:hypothetical protein